MTARSPKAEAFRRGALCTAAAFALAAGLAACASQPRPIAAREPDPVTPTQQYHAEVARAPEQIAIAPHREGLSSNQQAALAEFVSHWRDNGGGDITVRAPNGGDLGISRFTADAMMSFMRRLGVPPDRLRLVGYEPLHSERPPVVADFARYTVAVPDCSRTWSDLTATGSNKAYSAFGCAVTADAAIQVADPRDLVAPETADAADNSRREVVLGKYRQGQLTSSAKDDQASGQVSQAQSQ